MGATLIIAAALICREAFRALPAVIWALRCPADSPNYLAPDLRVARMPPLTTRSPEP